MTCNARIAVMAWNGWKHASGYGGLFVASQPVTGGNVARLHREMQWSWPVKYAVMAVVCNSVEKKKKRNRIQLKHGWLKARHVPYREKYAAIESAWKLEKWRLAKKAEASCREASSEETEKRNKCYKYPVSSFYLSCWKLIFSLYSWNTCTNGLKKLKLASESLLKKRSSVRMLL